MNMSGNEGCSTSSRCCCFCHSLKGLLIALIGLTVLLGTFDVLTPRVVNIVWPCLLIVLGLCKAYGHKMCKCCK